MLSTRCGVFLTDRLEFTFVQTGAHTGLHPGDAPA